MRRGKILMLATMAAGTLVLAGAIVFSWKTILEVWYLTRLDDADEGDRVAAIERLGRIGSVRAVPRLIERMRPDGSRETLPAIVACGRIGRGAATAAPALVEMARLTTQYQRSLIMPTSADPGRFFRPEEVQAINDAAVEALIEIGSLSLPAVIDALLEDYGLERGRMGLQRVLWSQKEEGVPLLLVAMDAAASRYWWEARQTLPGLGVAIAGELEKALGDGLLRSSATIAIKDLALVTLDHDSEKALLALDLLGRASDDPSLPSLAASLVTKVLELHPRVVTCLAGSFTTHEITELSRRSIAGLGRIGPRALPAMPTLIRCVRIKVGLRHAAADSIGRIGKGEGPEAQAAAAAAVSALLDLLDDESGAPRRWAESICWDLGTKHLSATRALVAALPGSGEESRRAITRILDLIGQNAVKALEEGATSGDPALREAALRAAILVSKP